MTNALPQDGDGRLSLEALGPLCSLAQANDVAAMGPGLGQSSDLSTLVANFIRECEVPLVLDADGLNVLAQRPDALKQHAGPVIITPHPGEFARL